MDILEFAYWSGCIGLFLAGAFLELIKIMIKAAKKERRYRKNARSKKARLQKVSTLQNRF